MPTAYSTLMVIWLMYVFVLTMVIMFKRVDRGQRVHELPMGPRSSYISKSVAWKWMTLPAIPSILGFYALAGGFQTYGLLSLQTGFVGLYCLHYLYRSVIYPRRLRTSEQQYSVVLIFLTWSYYIPMGYFMGTWFAQNNLLMDSLVLPVAMVGALLFVIGLVSTVTHDELLIRLRSGPSQDYAIPMRGLFRFSSNAHYFSEFVEWTGFALMTLSLPAFVHQIAVFALMLPQAQKTHTWYRDHFGARYPAHRTAFFPFLF